MTVCFFLILSRQIVNYKNSVISDQLKWTVGTRLGLSLFETILSCQSERIEKLKRGEFTLFLADECQKTASLITSYLKLWEVMVSLIIYSGLLYTAPLVAFGIVLMLTSVVYAFSFLIKKTHVSAIHGVSVRRQAYNFASQRYGLWQQIKLSSTFGSELIQLRIISSYA